MTTSNLKSKPLVSVIMPIYNAEGSLDNALESVEHQTLENIEILAINDGSTDASLQIMIHHAEMDPRIRVIDKPNQGYGASCNRGIDEARGTWIAILEPDDWLKPGMFKDMLDYANGFDEQPIDIVKTPYIRILDSNTENQRAYQCSYYHRIHPRHQPFTIDDPGVVDILRHHPSIWSAIYRKDFLDKKNIRFRPIPGSGWADNPFLIDTLCQADRIVYFDIPYYCYRENTDEEDFNFAMRNPTVPFQRWNDMQDELDRFQVNSDEIQCAHNSRGFTYLSGIIEYIPLSDPKVHDAAVKMVSRMNVRLVLGDPMISPAMKKLFCKLRGLPEPKANYPQYMRSLIGETAYQLRNNGPAFTLGSIEGYLKGYATRNGEQNASSEELLKHMEGFQNQNRRAAQLKEEAQQQKDNVEVITADGTKATNAESLMSKTPDSPSSK